MGFATVEGRNIHYEYPQTAEARVSQGCTVLMVHGAYDSHKVWRYQYSYLEREHSPLAIDLPGHGESQGPAINDPQGFREFIKAFVEVMDIAPFVFAGHSMGGSMALDYAIHHPEDLRGLIMVGSAPRWKMSAELIRMWKTDPEGARGKNIGLLFSKKTSRRLVEQYDRELSTTPAESCLADSENCDAYDLEAQLGKIDLPALVICGDEEEWIDGSKLIHSRMPHSTLEIVPAAGHAIMIEQPDKLNDAMGAYLKTIV